MLYSQEKKILFIHVQKTGGLSFEHILKSNITDIKSALRQHANAVEAKQYLGNAWDEYYKVAFVRNPWDRLVSWYSMITQLGVKLSWYEKILKSYGNERYNKIWQYVLSNSSSFEEFIHNCSEATSRYGWKPFLFNQIDYLTDGNDRIFIDYVGKYEDFERDVAAIFQQIDIKIEHIPHLNRSNRTDYRDYYDDTTREIVAKRFNKDIENFNYRF